MELHHIHDSLHAPSPFQWSRISDSNSNSIGLFVKHLMVCTEPANNTLEFSLHYGIDDCRIYANTIFYNVNENKRPCDFYQNHQSSKKIAERKETIRLLPNNSEIY